MRSRRRASGAAIALASLQFELNAHRVNPSRERVVVKRSGAPVKGADGLLASGAARRPSPARAHLETACWIVALLAAAILGYVSLDRAVHESRQASRLREAALAAGVLPSVATSGAPERALLEWTPRPGDPIGRLEIPDAEISAIISAGTAAVTLRRGIGHIEGTALPGQSGNVGLAGHRDTSFRGLRQLRPGDRISLSTAFGSYDYAVESIQTVAPERVDVLDPSDHPTLTLVTCFPFDFVGPAPLRFVLRAREVARSETAAKPRT
jgi:sortase A